MYFLLIATIFEKPELEIFRSALKKNGVTSELTNFQLRELGINNSSAIKDIILNGLLSVEGIPMDKIKIEFADQDKQLTSALEMHPVRSKRS